MGNDSVNRRFLKSDAKIRVCIQFVWCPNSNACLQAHFCQDVCIAVVFFEFGKGSFCFSKVLLLAGLHTRYAVYRALAIKRVDKIIPIS